MGQRPITPLGQAMLDSLPSRVRQSADYQGVIHALSREVDLLESKIESVRAQFNISTADSLLGAWEFQLFLPVGGQGASDAQRRVNILTRIRKLLGNAEGREWVQRVTEIVGMGWSYREHDPADPTSPADSRLAIVLPFEPTDPTYAAAQQEIRAITPAHLELDFTSSAVFRVDVSELDVGELTY